MSDMFNTTLNADTVVLAACETALGPVRIGEGVVGFPLAFLFAGARNFLLTQWQISLGVRPHRMKGPPIIPWGDGLDLDIPRRRERRNQRRLLADWFHESKCTRNAERYTFRAV